MAVNSFGFESGVNNDAMSAANTGADIIVGTGGTGVISTAQFAHGTRSLLMTGTTTSGGLYISKTYASTTGGGYHIYIRIATMPSADSTIMFIGAGSTRGLAVELTATGAIRVRDSANAAKWNGTVTTSAATLSTNTWYRISLYATQSATSGTFRLSAYLLDSLTPLTNMDSGLMTAQNTGSSPFTTFRTGAKAQTGSTTSVLYLDDWAYDPDATAQLAPYTEQLATPAVSLGAFVNPTTVGGTNGSQTVSWPPVSGAASYSAYIAVGDDPAQGDFTLVANNVTSPYTFINLPAGTRAFGIKARA